MIAKLSMLRMRVLILLLLALPVYAGHDTNCDGVVSFADIWQFRAQYGGAPWDNCLYWTPSEDATEYWIECDDMVIAILTGPDHSNYFFPDYMTGYFACRVGAVNEHGTTWSDYFGVDRRRLENE